MRRCWLAGRSVRWRGTNPFRRSGDPGSTNDARRDRGDWRDWLDGIDLLGGDDNPLAFLAFLVALIVFLVAAWFLLVPLLLAILDLTILILLTLVGLAARVVLHRPWEIEAVGPGGQRLTWQVVGWNRSRRTIAAVADHLSRGVAPPNQSPTFPPP